MKSILGMSEWQTRVAEVFSMTRSYRSTHAEYLDLRKKYVLTELSRTHGKAGKRVYSVYLQGYVQGLLDAGDALLWRDALEFCYVDADGVLFSTHRESTHRKTEEFFASGRGNELGNMPSCHFWKGTAKPFGVVESANARHAVQS